MKRKLIVSFSVDLVENDPEINQMLGQEDLIKTDEKVKTGEEDIIPEQVKDTVLEAIDSDREMEYDRDVTNYTMQSNAQLINDVLEVRKQVEKFKELLDASSHLVKKK